MSSLALVFSFFVTLLNFRLSTCIHYSLYFSQGTPPALSLIRVPAGTDTHIYTNICKQTHTGTHRNTYSHTTQRRKGKKCTVLKARLTVFCGNFLIFAGIIGFAFCLKETLLLVLLIVAKQSK